MNYQTPHSVWTSERVELLKKLWADGVSASKCAEELGGGITRNAVIGKVNRMNSPKRGTTEFFPRHKRAKRQKRPAKPQMFKPRPPAPINVDAHLPPDQSSFAVTFAKLQRHHCRWPIDVPNKPIMYCGARTLECGSWCLRHYRRAFQPVRVRSEGQAA